MSAAEWMEKTATEVEPGDRLRLESGTVMTVTRIEAPFLGLDHLVCFVEDTDVRWLAMPMPATAAVTVSSAARI